MLSFAGRIVFRYFPDDKTAKLFKRFLITQITRDSFSNNPRVAWKSIQASVLESLSSVYRKRDVNYILSRVEVDSLISCFNYSRLLGNF